MNLCKFRVLGMILLFPFSFLDVYFTSPLTTLQSGPSLRQVFYSKSCRVSSYKVGCYVSCVFFPYYRVKWLLIGDPSSHGLWTSQDVRKRRQNFVSSSGRLRKFTIHGMRGPQSRATRPYNRGREQRKRITLPYTNWLDNISYSRPDEGLDQAETSSMEKWSRHKETKKETPRLPPKFPSVF